MTTTRPATRVPAANAPVARVLPLLGVPHLDREFDYQVPETLSEEAVPGTRVRVRFAGRLVDGFIVGRASESGHRGDLAWVERVVSSEPVLTPALLRLVEVVARRGGYRKGRTREYDADEDGSALTGDPLALMQRRRHLTAAAQVSPGGAERAQRIQPSRRKTSSLSRPASGAEERIRAEGGGLDYRAAYRTADLGLA